MISISSRNCPFDAYSFKIVLGRHNVGVDLIKMGFLTRSYVRYVRSFRPYDCLEDLFYIDLGYYDICR